MNNMHPADELAWLRGEIRRLSQREAELRESFIAGGAPCDGAEARVDVKRSRRTVFRRERLPAGVLSDPALWESRLMYTVNVTSRDGTRLAPAPKPADAVMLLEPF